MKRHLFMALAMASMLVAGAPASAAMDVDTTAAKATDGTADAAKKTTHATGHAVSTGKTADQDEMSKLFHAIHRFGAQVGRQFDPSASYRRGAAVRKTRVP